MLKPLKPIPMRLLFIIKGLVVPGGGAERVFVDIVNELSIRDHQLTVATFDFEGQKFFYPLSNAVDEYALGAGEPGVSTPRANLPRISYAVRKLAHQIQPDVVVAFMHSTYVPVAFGLVGTEFPLISSEHTSAAHFDEHPVQRVLTRYAQQVSFAKTVVSQQVFEEHPAMRRGNLHVLPNPVNLDAFESARECWPTENSVLCVGGLRPEKDQQTLIAAFDRVAGEFPDWKLRIVGDGSERPAVERSIAQSAYASRIELPGVIRDVAAEYRKASFVAMPSRYESLGLVAIEAMASGRPVVGFSDCAGAVTLIKHGVNGLLADPGRDRVGSLAAALRVLMANSDLRHRLGSDAPATVQHYSVHQVIDQWESLLHAATAARAGSMARRQQPSRQSSAR